jgi:hypothetical protein
MGKGRAQPIVRRAERGPKAVGCAVPALVHSPYRQGPGGCICRVATSGANFSEPRFWAKFGELHLCEVGGHATVSNSRFLLGPAVGAGRLPYDVARRAAFSRQPVSVHAR